MSIHSFESNRAAKIERDKRMKEDAFKRRVGMEHKRRAECAPNRKAKARLEARIKDWTAFTGAPSFKAPMGAYHKPGSYAA